MAEERWAHTRGIVAVLGLNLFVAPCGVTRLVNTWLANYAPAHGLNITPLQAMPALVRRLGHLAHTRQADMCAALALPPRGDPCAPAPRLDCIVAFFCGTGGGGGGGGTWDLALPAETLAQHAATVGALVQNVLALGLLQPGSGGPELFGSLRQEPASGLVHLASLAGHDALLDEHYVDPRYLVVVAVAQFMRALAQVYVARKEASLVRAILDGIVDALAELALAYDEEGDGEEEEEEEERAEEGIDVEGIGEVEAVATVGGRNEYTRLARRLANPSASLDTLVARVTAIERAWHIKKAHEYHRRWKKLLKQHHVRLVDDGLLDLGGEATTA